MYGYLEVFPEFGPVEKVSIERGYIYSSNLTPVGSDEGLDGLLATGVK